MNRDQQIAHIQSGIQLISKQIQALLETLKKQKMDENRGKLYSAAISFLGKDGSPRDLASDDLACAETLNEIYKKVFGARIALLYMNQI